MALDPSIALGVKPLELANPLAQYGQVAQLQNYQNQNALAQYQLGAAQRAEQTATTQNELYAKHFNPATGGLDVNALIGEAAQRGQGGIIPNILKSENERQKAAADLSHVKTQTEAAQFKLTNDKLKHGLESLTSAPTPQDAIQKLNDGVTKGFFDMKTASAEAQKLQNMTPEDYQKYRIEKILGLVENKDRLATMLPKIKYQEAGGNILGIQDNPTMPGYGLPVPGMAIKKTATPGELMVDARARERIKIAQAQLNQGELDPAAIDFLATQVNNGDTSVLTGLARSKGAIAAVRNRAVELASATNATPADVTANRAEMVGQLAGQRAVGTQIANVQIAATEANKMIDVAKPYVSKVNPSDYPQVNAIGNYVARNTGDPNIVGLAASLNGLVNTYSRAINPKGVSTVDSRKHAREIINEAMAKGQLDEAFNVMGQEMNAALESGTTTRATMRGQMPGAAKSTEAPKAGSVQNGYRFKGGNPADQSSWEKL